MSNADFDMITCIYCQQPRPRPPKGEHIILKALGCKTMTSHVCGGPDSCNQLFGDTIDLELVRGSLVPIDRMLCGQGPSMLLKIPIFGWLPSDNVLVDCTIRINPIHYDVRPQIYAIDGLFKVVGGEDFEVLAELILSHDENWLDQVTSRPPAIGSGKEYTTPRLVLSKERNKNVFFVRATSAAAAESFIAALRNALPSLRERFRARAGLPRDKATVDLDRSFFRLSVSPNDPPRCAAKMAFNFLCHYLGPDVALRKEFDDVRNYIRGKNVLPSKEVITSSGERGLTIDTRFVSNWMDGVRPKELMPGLDQSHSITLLAQDRIVGAQVALFGKAEFQVVLGRVTEDLEVEKPIPAIFLTPLDGSGDRILTIMDLLKMPEFLHLTDRSRGVQR